MADSGDIPAGLRAPDDCGEASIVTRLEDGRAICIRTVTPATRDGCAPASRR